MTCIPYAQSAEKNPNVNIVASLWGQKWRWWRSHSWCEHSWEKVSVSRECPDACDAGTRWRVCAEVKELIVLALKEDGHLDLSLWRSTTFHISPTGYVPQFLHQNAEYSNKPCLLYMQQKNWEKNNFQLICEPSEYGWSEEWTIIIQSPKGG